MLKVKVTFTDGSSREYTFTSQREVNTFLEQHKDTIKKVIHL